MFIRYVASFMMIIKKSFFKVTVQLLSSKAGSQQAQEIVSCLQ